MDAGLKIVRRSSFKASPWKNGGGITHEAVRVPPDRDPFRFRVSVAQIDRSGPFSDFSGYRRNMVLLQGLGLQLQFGDGRQQTLQQVGDLAEFDGALPTQCNLLAGPCTDLNLMVLEEAVVTARVQHIEGPTRIGATEFETTLIFSLAATLELTGGQGEVAYLAPWDLALLTGYEGQVTLLPQSGATTPTAVFFATISH